jgi:hypothetical protein
MAKILVSPAYVGMYMLALHFRSFIANSGFCVLLFVLGEQKKKFSNRSNNFGQRECSVA